MSKMMMEWVAMKKASWGRKNLYLAYDSGTKIIGINPWVGTNTDGKVVEEAQRVGSLDILDDYPTAMGIVSADSKVYMMGGFYPSHKRDDCISNLVYEFANMGDGDLSLSPCDSIPVIPAYMPFPVVAKIKGKIYVLFSNWASGIYENSKPDLTNGFLVLESERSEGRSYYRWRSLPIPTSYDEKNILYGYEMSFRGVFGNKLLVRTPQETDMYYSFDVVAEKWEKQYIYLGRVQCMITLSLSHSVVIYTAMFPHTSDVDVYAALLDGAGKPLRIQYIPDVIPDALDIVYDMSLIELEKEDQDQDQEPNRNSSTFCLVYASQLDGHYNVGLSVVSVSLLSSKEQVQEPKRLKLSKRPFDMGIFNHLPSSNPFLEAQVVEKRQYTLAKDLSQVSAYFDSAFFL
ncbi:hypothetical protein LINPERPRIM_LOCUS19819 [Linum perenne]